MVEKNKSFSIVFADESRKKNVIIADNQKVENFNIFDIYNLIPKSPTIVKRKYTLKSKCVSPMIKSVELTYNLQTSDYIRVCHKNRIEYKNTFGQSLIKVYFDNVKFACQTRVVNKANLFDMFEFDSIRFNNVFDNISIYFADKRIQRIFDDMIDKDTKQICADLARLFSPLPHSNAYYYFIRDIVGLKYEGNAIIVRPNTRLINCDFYIDDLEIPVKKSNTSCYLIDNKIFSNSIPINYEDIEKLDCILY